MERRARALARPLAAPQTQEGSLEVVLFSLGRERYALETRAVREVLRLIDLTPLPGAPAPFAGVTNHRGEILVVVDLRALFGIAAEGVTDLSRVVVLGEGESQVGLLADQVSEVKKLRPEAIEPPPDSVSGIGREVLRGLTGDATLVLDAEALVRHRRLFLDPVN
jgi:purine-binding chemotaxis protein CheW